MEYRTTISKLSNILKKSGNHNLYVTPDSLCYKLKEDGDYTELFFTVIEKERLVKLLEDYKDTLKVTITYFRGGTFYITSKREVLFRGICQRVRKQTNADQLLRSNYFCSVGEYITHTYESIKSYVDFNTTHLYIETPEILYYSNKFHDTVFNQYLNPLPNFRKVEVNNLEIVPTKKNIYLQIPRKLYLKILDVVDDCDTIVFRQTMKTRGCVYYEKDCMLYLIGETYMKLAGNKEVVLSNTQFKLLTLLTTAENVKLSLVKINGTTYIQYRNRIHNCIFKDFSRKLIKEYDPIDDIIIFKEEFKPWIV